MKRIIQLVSLTAGAAILQGCAGHNTTMFMTKSNAGLDLDMKPPTAEINISRKEAVIEPAFENGQTPPVMASFKPKVGWGRFGNYFLGVDQTFAGGDAAVTMASLYDAPTPSVVELGEYDSTLTVTNKIKQHGWFWAWFVDPLLTPAEPDAIRPFIFGTDTQLGLKVAWSGAGGQFPDTVKAGFNRKEFAWAPITMSKERTSVKMPSFLATIESNIGGGADTNEASGTNASGQNGGIKSIQYFATGEAASRLARQKDVRDAMLKRLDPSYESASPRIGKGIVARQMLTAMENAFEQLKEDKIAQTFYQRLQDLHGVKIPSSFEATRPPMFFYARENGETNVFNELTTKSNHNPTNLSLTLADATTYIADLDSSMSVIRLIKIQLAISTNDVFLLVDRSTNRQLILPTKAMEIEKQFWIQDGEHSRIQKEILADKDISSAFDYFQSLTKP